MTKCFLKVSFFIFFFLGNQLVYGQYQKDINKVPAQLAPGWIQNSQLSILDPAVSIKKNGSKTSASKPILSSNGSIYNQSKILNIGNFPAYKEDEVFIKFKSAVTDNIKSFDQAGKRNNSIANDRLKTIISLAKIDRLKKISHNEKFKKISRTYKAALEKGMSLEKAVEILEKSPDIEYVEKIPEYYTLQAPDDPFYANGNQYALDLIHAVEAFPSQVNNKEIFIAVVDDAFLYDHPDLIANVDISKCFDVADNDSDTRPPSTGVNIAGPLTFSHGTHVGGIAGAVTNNGQGIASVSNNKVKLFGIKATSDETEETRNIENSFEGVLKAIENGANVINMSFGGAGNSQTWQDMINDATNDGVVFVGAAGNGNTSTKNYPAAYDNVIAVSNTNENDQKNPSSHYGSWVSIAAPGTSIVSTVAGEDGTSGSYASYSGTSMASPMVAGLVGLMLSEDNTLNYAQILSILQSSADNIDALNPGFETKLGAGRINALNAMLEVRGIEAIPEAEFVASDPNIFVGQNVTFSSQSLGNDLTYSWSFQGGTPSNGTGESVAVTYNNEGVYDVSLTVSNISGTDVLSIDNYVAVVEPQDCAILNYPFPGTRSFYSYVDNDTDENNGPVIGQNINQFTQFANLYNYLPGNFVSGGLFAIGKIVSDESEKAIVRFKVWEESDITSIPGKVIATQEVSYSDLKITGQNQAKTNRESYTEIIFDNPAVIPTNGKFYMGFEIFYEEGDTIGFYTNEDGEGNGNESFAVYQGTWLSFTEFDFSANIEMLPILVGGSYIDIEPFVAEAGACEGNAVNFSTDGMQQKVSTYEWTFEGGIPSTSSEANPVVTYNNQGVFEAKLLVTLEGCEEARRKFTQEIKIIDCELSPIAEFTANKFAIEAGDSIQFLERSENATGYSWIFEGGIPGTSEIADPYVIYPDPGVYKVRLEVQSPLGNVSSIVKDDLIQVYEPGFCNFYTTAEISNFESTNTSILYVSDGDGYITGTGSGDLAKAEFFDMPEVSSYLDKIEIAFGEASTNDNSSTVDVVIFDDSGFDNEGIPGAPGEILATKAVNISEVSSDVDNEVLTEIVFDDPVLLDGPFYAGILLNHANETDTVAILSTQDDEVSEGTSWELQSNNVWVQTSERWETEGGTNPLDISLYITAYTRQFNEEVNGLCQPLSVEENSSENNIKVFPNPFHSSTKIQYNLETSADVRLEIYNSVGNRVTILEDSYKQEGIHEAIFNAGPLARGLYIYKLQIGDDIVKTGRIILAK